jgi:hypothetical protein
LQRRVGRHLCLRRFAGLSERHRHAPGQGPRYSLDDINKKEGVVIIDETVARRLWPGEDPIGRMAQTAGMDVRVIGVMADVHESSVEGNPGWQMYVSGTAPQFGPEGAQLVVRSKVSPETLAASVMSTLRQINPAQPATEFRPIQRLVDLAVSPRRFFVLLVSIFAGLGGCSPSAATLSLQRLPYPLATVVS